LHGKVDLILLFINFSKIVFQQVVQADVDISVVVLLEEVRDQAVSYLGVKYKVAYDVVLADECRGIFAKVMKYFHNMMRFHHFFESMEERVYRL
jgi:hypothetical protein